MSLRVSGSSPRIRARLSATLRAQAGRAARPAYSTGLSVSARRKSGERGLPGLCLDSGGFRRQLPIVETGDPGGVQTDSGDDCFGKPALQGEDPVGVPGVHRHGKDGADACGLSLFQGPLRIFHVGEMTVCIGDKGRESIRSR